MQTGDSSTIGEDRSGALTSNGKVVAELVEPEED